MFRKIVIAVIVIPLAIVIVAFAVANRQSVTVSFDPFSATAPAYTAILPLFLLLFIVLIVGVIVGGAAAWIRQSPWRRTARQLDSDVRALHQEMESLRRHLSAAEAARTRDAAPAREPVPMAAIPPPAS
ncbi:MAG TPA: lipopolysaccharide assembly protein LapA domain-containing protein [Pseudolabrys sp.]|nr:lipopolysaccharide assembly protein LapA domain-containing protein [Pseudolabrys sp.]